MPHVDRRFNFSVWLQTELDKRQWSQAELARAAGLSRAVINKLLNGKTFPQPTTLSSVAHAFKMPVETIYRAASLLPEITAADSFFAETTYLLQLIKNPQRRATVLNLLKALVDEEANE
jgi:transcriptional regulator with XRE-family HTH domain